MLSDTSILLYLIYKIITFFLGSSIIVLGFILFFKGFSKATGNLEYSFLGKTIKLSNAAPGIYLFLFGTTVILVSMFKGVELKSQVKQHTSSDSVKVQKLFVDTSNVIASKISIDSVINLARTNYNRGKLLNAFKLFCVAKGISLENASTPKTTVDDINMSIANIANNLNELARKSSDIPLSSEETKSVTISEDKIDTTAD